MHLELTPVQGHTGVTPYQFVQGKLLPSEGLSVEHTVSKLQCLRAARKVKWLTGKVPVASLKKKKKWSTFLFF